jgi:surface protein
MESIDIINAVSTKYSFNYENDEWELLIEKSLTITLKLEKIYFGCFHYECHFDERDFLEKFHSNNMHEIINKISFYLKEKKFKLDKGNSKIIFYPSGESNIIIDLNVQKHDNEESSKILSNQLQNRDRMLLEKINKLEEKLKQLEIQNQKILNASKQRENDKKSEIKPMNNNSIKGNLLIKSEMTRVINYNNSNSNSNNEKQIKECDIIINKKPKNFSCEYSFKNKGEKEEITFNFKNNINNLSQLFYDCNSFIDLKFINFSSSIIDTSQMFFKCSSLKTIDFGDFNTKNVKNMSYMFAHCSSLEKLDLLKFNTENVEDMSGMFYNCSSLEELNLSKFNTNNVKDMSNMFSYCTSLKNLDLCNFNTQKVNDMYQMFYKCKSLNTLNIQSFTIIDNIDTEMLSYINKECQIKTNKILTRKSNEKQKYDN